jgi:hypothetical protein
VSALTAHIAGLELKLLARARTEEELREQVRQQAEQENKWAQQAERWRETEARRKHNEAMMRAAWDKERRALESQLASALANSGAPAPALLSDRESVRQLAGSVPEASKDPARPDSVHVSRLTGDIHALQHQLRNMKRQEALVERFLAAQGLPSVQEVCKDKKGGMTPIAKSEPTAALSSTMPAQRSPLRPASVPRSRSAERLAQTQPLASDLERARKARAAAARVALSVSTPTSRSPSPPKEKGSAQANEASPSASTSVPAVKSSPSYKPHRSAPVFKSLVEEPPPPPRRPAVPVLSAASKGAGALNGSSTTEPAAALQPKPAVPRQPRPAVKLVAPAANEPTVAAAAVSLPQPLASSAATPASNSISRGHSDDAVKLTPTKPPAPSATVSSLPVPSDGSSLVLSPLSPTQASINLGLQLSDQILAEQQQTGIEGDSTEESAVELATAADKMKAQTAPASIFGGASFSQIAAEASAAVFQQSPTAAPLKASHTGVSLSSSPVLPSLPSFLGIDAVQSALASLKASTSLPSSDPAALDHVVLLAKRALLAEVEMTQTRCAPPSDEHPVPFAKVIVYARGKDALTRRWSAMQLDPDLCLFIVLLMREPIGSAAASSVEEAATTLSRFVLIEWQGADASEEDVEVAQSFAPLFTRFLRHTLPSVSLSVQASHPSQVSADAIAADLARAAASRGRHHRNGSNDKEQRAEAREEETEQSHTHARRDSNSSVESDDSTGSFVDLNAQLALERAQPSPSETTLSLPVAVASPAAPFSAGVASVSSSPSPSSSVPSSAAVVAERPALDVSLTDAEVAAAQPDSVLAALAAAARARAEASQMQAATATEDNDGNKQGNGSSYLAALAAASDTTGGASRASAGLRVRKAVTPWLSTAARQAKAAADAAAAAALEAEVTSASFGNVGAQPVGLKSALKGARTPSPASFGNNSGEPAASANGGTTDREERASQLQSPTPEPQARKSVSFDASFLKD